jgi:hypothetical protein
MTHALTPERIGEMLMGAVTDAEPWRAQAACAGEPADVFFPPEVAGPGGGANYSRARLVCAACPVQDTCQRRRSASGDRGHDSRRRARGP